ncbi:MAG: hypothetical protein ABFR62_12220 [Bacteroidota bacterium]
MKYSVKPFIQLFLLFIALLPMVSCKTTVYQGESVSVDVFSYKELSKKKYIDNINYNYNTDSTYVICSGQRSKLSYYISFFIYSISENNIVFETNADVEQVDWNSSKQVVYYPVPGIISTENSEKRKMYFDIRD